MTQTKRQRLIAAICAALQQGAPADLPADALARVWARTLRQLHTATDGEVRKTARRLGIA